MTVHGTWKDMKPMSFLVLVTLKRCRSFFQNRVFYCSDAQEIV